MSAQPPEVTSPPAGGNGVDRDTPPTFERPKQQKIPRFGARKVATRLQDELRVAQEQLERVDGLSLIEVAAARQSAEAELAATRAAIETEKIEGRADLERELTAARKADEARRAALKAEIAALVAEKDRLEALVVTTADTQILQEVGVYEFAHPLDDSVAYKAALANLRDEIKAMARKDGGAILASTDWTVNGSKVEGRRMVREYSKLMLRAYNSEVDSLVRTMKPYKLATSTERLDKARDTIARLGKTMSIQISPTYHHLRRRELELTADHLEKVAREKEAEREEKARLREERQAQQEMERERARLEKERQHFANALSALEAKGDLEAAGRLREQIEDVDRAIADVDYRAANIRAGYVYVISNIGAFGERMIKVGMTRRLEPMDRVRELGDASVPFRFDVHALFFSKDAVGIEQAMHDLFADRRVNKINLRREFFYATPAEARDALAELAGDLLEYTDVPEAVEFRQSHGNSTQDTTRR